MTQLLGFVSWRHLKRHRLRTALTFLGIALGVATIVAISVVNHTLTTSFQRTIDLVAGKAVLQVSNGESGVSESMFPTIRDTEGIQDAAPAVEGVLPVLGFEGERLYIYGVDLLTDFSIREHQFVEAAFEAEQALDFIARPDSIAVTESFASRTGLFVGAKITLATARGARVYTVRAMLKPEGPAKVFGGNFALMDLPVAQIAFGKEGKLDIVDVTVEASATIETVKARLETRLQGMAQVERPRKRGEQIESLLTSFRVGLFFVSLIALFVGFFLIYNTAAVSVVQRKREIGALRCLGMLRRDVFRLILLEAVALAVVGSIVGTLVGFLLAQAALVSVGQTVSNLFSQIDLSKGHLQGWELAIALASGVGVAVFAALHPAWEATRVNPLENARRTVWSPKFKGKTAVSSMLGLLCLLMSPLIHAFSSSFAGPVEKFSVGILAMLVFLLGLSFLCPLIIFYAAKPLGQFISRIARLNWADARLATDNLRRNPVRSGITVATLVISLAAIFTIAAFVNSVRGSLLAWVNQMVTADLIVSSGARTAGPRNVPLREDLLPGLNAMPGVQVVDLYRLIRSNYQGKPIVIESFSAAASAGVRTLPMAKGDGRLALRDMGAGKGVIISESFQSRFGKNSGDTIQLPTPVGLVAFKILGVYIDYSSDVGSVLMDRALYKKFWHDELVDAFDLWLERGADEAGVIKRIKEQFGEKYQLFISTHRELREAVIDIMEQSFIVNYAVEMVAVIVAIFSVINTLLASVLDRTREIGVLRAVGATPGQVRRLVMTEAGWMGLLGGILGLIAGSIMSYHHVVYNTKVLTGWTFQYYYPFDVAFLSLIASVALCLLAGYVPANQAASTPIVSAIGYE